MTVTEGYIPHQAPGVPPSAQGQMVTILHTNMRHGQPESYEVLLADGGKATVPTTSIYLDKRWIHDTHIHTLHALSVREGMKDWDRTREFYGSAWEGVELFYHRLAAFAPRASFVSPGWHKYPDSTRSDKDAKTWRLVLQSPDMREPTVVHLFSVMHDKVWTLNSAIFSTREVDATKLRYLGDDDDHWQRVYDWVIGTATVLQQDGYDYSQVILEYRRRAAASLLLTDMALRIGQTIASHVKSSKPAPPVSVGYSNVPLPAGAVAAYSAPLPHRPYSTISINPRAQRNRDYVDQIVRHEMIHRALGGTCCGEDPHGEKFQELADLIGLDPEYRD